MLFRGKDTFTLRTPILQKLHYAWVVAGIKFITLIVTAAVRATPSILIVPLEQEFGWSRVTISFAISINLLLYGLIGPFAGRMLNRYGSRRVMMISLATLSGGVALTTLVRTSWQLVLLWGVLVGTGTGMTAIVLGATVVHRWFRKQQGLVIGVLTASTATGQLLFLPILAHFVEQGGWRIAVWMVVGAVLLALTIVLIGMKSDPSEIGVRPFGEDGIPLSPEVAISSDPVREAFSALGRGVRSID